MLLDSINGNLTTINFKFYVSRATLLEYCDGVTRVMHKTNLNFSFGAKVTQIECIGYSSNFLNLSISLEVTQVIYTFHSNNISNFSVSLQVTQVIYNITQLIL